MLSKITAIVKVLSTIVDLVKRAILLFQMKKREKLIEDIKSDDKDKQLDALDELRK